LKDSQRRTTLYLLLPSLVVKVLFVIVPLANIILFSFLKFQNYRFTNSFTIENYTDLFAGGQWMFTLGTLVKTLGLTGLVLLMVIVGAYPIAYLLARKVRSPVTQTVILLLCILPFWTSYIIRMITWVPMLGQGGLINLTLLYLGLIDAPIKGLLFSYPSMVFVEFFLWIVFMVGPIFWVIARIPDEIMEASLNLGASRVKRLLTITLPMSIPGIATGTVFVFVMIMSDFATPKIIGGGHYFMFASYVDNSMAFTEYGLASSYSVLLTAVTLFFVYFLFRSVDLRKELYLDYSDPYRALWTIFHYGPPFFYRSQREHDFPYGTNGGLLVEIHVRIDRACRSRSCQ
jgi:putative spermidine/putrescine transport system permease protein